MSQPHGKLRIQKHLAAMGVASRRAVEEMILEGRISLNGKLISDVPCFVDPLADEIRVDGRPVRKRPPKLTYFLLNKPKGVVCTQSDPQGRPRAVDLLPKTPERLFCVGRLDADSIGVILLTNDGELTQQLTHPSYGVPKTYVVQVDGGIGSEEIEKLKRGVWLDGNRTKSASVKVLRRSHKMSLIEIQLFEGRNREIRRLLARLGHKVRRLKRVAIGKITDRGLKVGSCRELTPAEVRKLKPRPTD